MEPQMVGLLLISIASICLLIMRLNYKDKQLVKLSDASQKQRSLYSILNNMYAMEQSNMPLGSFLKNEGYKKIAIYGIHYIGQRLFDSLSKEGFKIEYLIDKGKKKEYGGVKVYAPQDDLKPVDAVIVTPVTYYNEIFLELQKKMDCPILSIEDILVDINF